MRWRWQDVQDLPADVYDDLLDWLDEQDHDGEAAMTWGEDN